MFVLHLYASKTCFSFRTAMMNWNNVTKEFRDKDLYFDKIIQKNREIAGKLVFSIAYSLILFVSEVRVIVPK